MPPKSHAVLGASSSERWMACPGSVRLSEGRPDDTSIYAIEGTAAHEVVEACLRQGLDAAYRIGDMIAVPEEKDDGTVEIHQVEVTEEMADAVQVMLDYVRERWDDGDPDLHLELQMDLAPIKPASIGDDMFGTGDVVLWHGTTTGHEPSLLEIIDYKHGQGVAVDAVENSQLRYYGLAAVVTLRKRPDRIRMTIVQPRGHHPAGIIRSDEISFKELKSWKSELFGRAEATQAPDAPLVPGDHCRFCRALAICPAQRDYAIEVARTEFEPLEPPKPEELTPEEIAQVLRAKGHLQDWMNAVESHAIQALDRGESVPGFKLVEGRKGNRQWADEDAADTYLKGQGLKVAERYKPRQLISPTQAEKILKKQGKALPDDRVTRSDGRPKIVPEGDRRPALPPSVAADFEVIPEPA